MAKHMYMTVYYHADHVYLEGTHMSELDAAIAYFHGRPGDLAPQGKSDLQPDYPHRRVITHLKTEVMKIFWWLVQYLCDDGWEPFAVTSDTGPEGEIRNQGWYAGKLHLRKAVVA